MGHRSFGNKASTKQSSSRDDSSNSLVGSEGEKMNGLQKITQVFFEVQLSSLKLSTVTEYAVWSSYFIIVLRGRYFRL